MAHFPLLPDLWISSTQRNKQTWYNCCMGGLYAGLCHCPFCSNLHYNQL